MSRQISTKIIAAAPVLATTGPSMAAGEYHLMCVGPNNSGYGTMLGSASPSSGNMKGFNMCGHMAYITQVVAQHIRDCRARGIDTRVYYHNDYNTRLCTIAAN